MAHILIAFYSRTGMTRRIASQLAEKLNADTLAIEDMRSREGVFGYVRSALEVMRGISPVIAPPAIDPARYDLVVLGTPVWVSHVCSPMRRFLNDHGHNLRRVAFFCTLGGSGADSAFRDMRELTGKEPEATCALTDQEILKDSRPQAIDEFVAKLRGSPIGAASRKPTVEGARHAGM